MESGLGSAVQFACHSESATLQQRTSGVIPRGVGNQLVENRCWLKRGRSFSTVEQKLNLQKNLLHSLHAPSFQISEESPFLLLLSTSSTSSLLENTHFLSSDQYSDTVEGSPLP
ncbi:hypothetical protein LR48_Vigan350s000100 [Vigna angularis]|uniref:Uncharacterized protein n=1 Tax=Phaseolus angularis TaxID=3914 RepID=A0A0L9T9H7_PHAAN|nr:hypothetical protein LR48_Vigan350s000100 [Vigna angularis]